MTHIPPGSYGYSYAPTEDENEVTNDGKNVYLVGFGPQTRQTDIENIISKYGKIESCMLMMDPRTGESRGYCFVTMSTPSEANVLIAAMDGTTMDGQKISARLSRRGGPRKQTPGSYLGTRKERYYREKAGLPPFPPPHLPPHPHYPTPHYPPPHYPPPYGAPLPPDPLASATPPETPGATPPPPSGALDPRDPYYRDPYRGDPYRDPRDPYYRDPYARDPYALDPYYRDPYPRDPYARDPYARDPYFRDPYYRDPYARDPYPRDPYLDPYARDPRDPRDARDPRDPRDRDPRRDPYYDATALPPPPATGAPPPMHPTPPQAAPAGYYDYPRSEVVPRPDENQGTDPHMRPLAPDARGLPPPLPRGYDRY